MKTKAVMNHWGRLLATSISISIAMFISAAAATTASDSQGDSEASTERMKSWQERMSETFRDTWQGLWQDKDTKKRGESTVATTSVDLREQQDGYTVRLNLPNRDLEKVEITLSGDTLHIVAPAEGKAGRYEQDIRLKGVAANAAPQIERKAKDNLIVVNVPKSSDLASTGPSFGPPTSLWDAWDRDVLERMDRMQREMNRIFNQTFSEFSSQPEFSGFFNQARFGSSLDFQEEKDKYIVRAYLPGRDMNNVNVTIEGQVLKLEAKGESTRQEQKESTLFSSKAQYSQALTLPGPVQADKMTVERNENMLVVTVPKASEG
jgi:HSP20 family molecular chaperone IbpA